MNALEDTRELVTVTSAPDNWVESPQPRARFIASYLDDLIHKYPDVELTTIRIHEFDGVITVTGRRGRLAAECPSCHTTDGHPHTAYCRASEQQRTVIPPGSLVPSEAFVVPLEDPNDTGAADNEPNT